ncbi:MAG TPA: hypothetical protein VK789_17045 [Bryobacteraceae bacterium]|nr:hypothetical protein [Bryobacteraceae bacterium]
MVLALVNNPERVPPHWTDLVCAGQFALFVFDARSHSARNPDASVPVGSASLVLFDNQAEATTFANDLVAKHPELSCEIYDYGREYGQPLATIYNGVFYEKYLGRGLAKRNTAGGALAMAVGIALVVIDFRHDLTWFWGYILGVKFLIIGTTLLINGLLGLRTIADSKTSKEPTPLPATHP